MEAPAAKKDDKIISDGTNQVYIKMSTTPPTVSPFPFTYEGSIDKSCSHNVFVMSKPVATVDSTAISNSTPKSGDQLGGGTVEATVNNIATINSGSSSVYINGKKAARKGDDANTWTFKSPSPSVQVTNAKVEASGSVYIGG